MASLQFGEFAPDRLEPADETKHSEKIVTMKYFLLLLTLLSKTDRRQEHGKSKGAATFSTTDLILISEPQGNC